MILKTISAIAILLSLLMVTQAVVSAAHPAAPVTQEKKNEQHPHIRAALMELREAKRELQTAAHDFGGHRKEAIEAVDTAINQLQQALQYDKK